MTAKPTALTARQKMELSKIPQQKLQREMMRDDLDLERMVIYLKQMILFDAVDRVIDVNVTRSIDGASTIQVSLNDYDRTILRSAAINSKLDVQIDGMWFRLVKVTREVGSDTLEMTFEQREIAVLRSYPKLTTPGHKNTADDAVLVQPKIAHRKSTTRAEFILNLIREVKEFNIPVVIPELHRVQPIEKKSDGSIDWGTPDTVSSQPGVAKDAHNNNFWTDPITGAMQAILKVNTKPITKEQINNANIVLAVGLGMGARRKVLLCAITVCIDESELHNLDHGDGTSIGIFQQIDSWGSFDDRHDVATASRIWYGKLSSIGRPGQDAIGYDKDHPFLSVGELAHNIQKNRDPLVYYQFVSEADKILTAFGLPGKRNKDGSYDPWSEGAAADANNNIDTSVAPTSLEDYQYYRGIPKGTSGAGRYWEREDNWACIRRLAEEVGWRAFFIGGVFYYISDDDLFKMQPIITVTESTKGINGIGFDYDIGKKGATLEIQAQVGRWLAPPGAIIVVQQMGHLDGRWMVNQFTRSLFSSNADINLSKPNPRLPEPKDDQLSGGAIDWAHPQGSSPGSAPDLPDNPTVQLPADFTPTHPTDGLSGYPAIDVFCNPGDVGLSPVDGVVWKLSGHDPKEGGPSGGAYGWSAYVKGDKADYFITHMMKRFVQQDQKVQRGDPIGQAANAEIAHMKESDTHFHVGKHDL